MTSTAVMSKCLAGFSTPARTVLFGRRGVVVPQFKSSTEETRKVMSFLLHDKANAQTHRVRVAVPSNTRNSGLEGILRRCELLKQCDPSC